MTTLKEFPRLCTTCKLELGLNDFFCSNCGVKYQIPAGDRVGKARSAAEMKVTELLLQTSLQSLKGFKWVQEKQSMYGLPNDRNKKIKYLKMEGAIKNIKPLGALGPVKSLKNQNKNQNNQNSPTNQNISMGKNIPNASILPTSNVPKSDVPNSRSGSRPSSRCVSPSKLRSHTPKSDNIRSPIISDATTSQFLTDIVTAIDDHYIKLDGTSENQIENQILMEKKILLTNIFEFKHSQSIEENDRIIKQIIGREARKINEIQSFTQFNREIPQTQPFKGKDIGDVSHYLDDIGSVKDLYRVYLEREKLFSGLVHTPYENHGFRTENLLPESLTVSTPYAAEKNPKKNVENNNNDTTNTNNNSNPNNKNGSINNNDYNIMNNIGSNDENNGINNLMDDAPRSENEKESENENNHRNANPSSSQIQESWFWGPSDQYDIHDGDEERTGVLWTSVLTGYNEDENYGNDENGGVMGNDEGVVNKVVKIEKENNEKEEKKRGKQAEKQEEKEKEKEKELPLRASTPGTRVRTTPYHIYFIIARMFKKICTDIKQSLIDTEIFFSKDYSVRNLFEKLMIIKKSMAAGVLGGIEIKKEYELFCLQNIRRKAEANGVVAQALKLAVSAYNSHETNQNNQKNQNNKNCLTQRSQISGNNTNDSINNSLIADDNQSIGSSVTNITDLSRNSTVFNISKNGPRSPKKIPGNKNVTMKNNKVKISQNNVNDSTVENNDSIYESIYDSNNSDNNDTSDNNHNINTSRDSMLTTTGLPPSPSRLKLMKGVEIARAKAAVRASLMGEGSQLLQLQREESYLLVRIKEDETTTMAVIDAWLPRLRQSLKCCQIAEARTYAVLQHKAASLIQKMARDKARSRRLENQK